MRRSANWPTSSSTRSRAASRTSWSLRITAPKPRGSCRWSGRRRRRVRSRSTARSRTPRRSKRSTRRPYLRLGEFPVADPEWEVGIEDVLALPLYHEADGFGTVVDPDPHVLIGYDRIPKHTVEIRRKSAVTSADGHHLGHVDGFLVSVDGTADIVLERGHLWGRREIVVPAASVEHIEDDAVTLTLTKDEVGALASRRVHRWF